MNSPHKYYCLHEKDIAEQQVSVTTDLFLGVPNHSLGKETHLKQEYRGGLIPDTRRIYQ